MMTTDAILQGPEETVTITKSEYDKLISDQEFLRALEGAGVDNWEGYSYACKLTEGDDE